MPISESLINSLNILEEEHAAFLDCNYPQDPPLWTEDDKADFIGRAREVYEKLRNELGIEFEVENEIRQCIE